MSVRTAMPNVFTVMSKLIKNTSALGVFLLTIASGFCLGLLAPENIAAVPVSVGAFAVIAVGAIIFGAVAIASGVLLVLATLAIAAVGIVFGAIGAGSFAGFIAGTVTFAVAISAIAMVLDIVNDLDAHKGE